MRDSQEETTTEEAKYISRSIWARYGKRISDIIVSAILIILLSPILILTAIVIKITSPGPVFFFQTRTGINQTRFTLYKFRSMRGSRTPDAKELVPLDHPDITRIGYVIRRFKIDELPQLFNIFLGDMSIIGPRPTLPDQTDHYNDFQLRRLLIRPGATGLAQVHGNVSIDWEERIKFDVYYVQNCNFTLDAAILLKTVLVIFLGEERFNRPFEETAYARKAGKTNR